MGVEEAAGTGRRRSQEIARERSRRRRPNMDSGAGQHVVKVRLTDAEYASVKTAAGEASMTVPWYLAQCALNPVAPSRTKSGKVRAWLSWPKRQAVAASVWSATNALDMIRLHHLSKVGSNLNQLTREFHTTGGISEEIVDVLADVRELIDELRERAEELSTLAREVVRR